VAEHHAPPERIEARGLYLRRHQVGDADAIAAAVAESLAELQPWVPWANQSAARQGAQRHRLEEVVPHWERGTEYVYLVFRPGEDKLLGSVGLHRRVGPDALEIGYWLRTSETGRGTMTEAVRALANEALAWPGVDRVELHCDEANQKSAAIARRLGFRLARTGQVDPESPAESGRQMVWVLDQPVAASAVYYLIGLPGVGKYTVALAMARLAAERGQRLVVVDNHYVNNVIFGLVGIDGRTPLDPAVWARVAEVAEIVFTTVETLSPAGWSFVFTNYLDHGSPDDHRLYQRVRQVANARGRRFVPVRLVCEPEELCRRVTSPERSGRLKLVDPVTVRQLATTRPLLLPDDDDVITIDATRSAVEESAAVILDRVAVWGMSRRP
jgi:RimJ/RimL family protein N-acetyltransferase